MSSQPVGDSYPGNDAFEIRDDPLMRVGDAYYLFLSRRLDAYVVLGGPDGRFVVTEGVVSSLSARYPERGIDDVGIEGMAEDELRAEVGAAL